MRIRNYAIVFVFALVLLSACKKDFLNAKPEKALVIPNTLDDLQALLDNSNSVMNWSPSMGLIASDDVYVPDDGYVSANVLSQNSYIWAERIYEGYNVPDWERSYHQVFYSNVVLDAIETLEVPLSEERRVEVLKGSALFYRALAFYGIAQQFAEPYVESTAKSTLGIPIRVESDINIKSVRSSLYETYRQIIDDLRESIGLLEEQTMVLTRPSKAAAYALLARVFQTMENYTEAEENASKCLQLNKSLLNYNDVSIDAARSFSRVLQGGENPEVIFYSVLNANDMLASSLTSVDTNLYHSYNENDLRKNVFFTESTDGVFRFKGSYTGAAAIFSGLSTNEVYLIRAESRVRAGNLDGALEDLNTLLEMRWQSGTFTPYWTDNQDKLLALILEERRKELVYRNLRWTDLRRLNRDPRFAKSIIRNVSGTTIELPPNDLRYTFPIPEKVIAQSGMEQNVRSN